MLHTFLFLFLRHSTHDTGVTEQLQGRFCTHWRHHLISSLTPRANTQQLSHFSSTKGRHLSFIAMMAIRTGSYLWPLRRVARASTLVGSTWSSAEARTRSEAARRMVVVTKKLTTPVINAFRRRFVLAGRSARCLGVFGTA